VGSVDSDTFAARGQESLKAGVIDTAHLILQPWVPAHILALIEQPERFERAAGWPAAPGLREMFASDDVSPEWLAALEHARAPDPWQYGFALVHRATGTVIGSAGFKGPPDATGMVEIAYGVAPTFRGHGYATEAAAALVDFAFATPFVTVIRAHTLPTTNASTRVLANCGFVQVGVVEDPQDGRVWRWERAR
jgi:RimJ/RimL family protein N-acetyltransferase